MILAVALAGPSLEPLPFVAIIGMLLVAEAAIEMAPSAPDHSQEDT